MGGELKDCGCYDGPFSETDHRIVAIRCEEHAPEPSDPGWKRIGPPKMATSLKTRKRRR